MSNGGLLRLVLLYQCDILSYLFLMTVTGGNDQPITL